MIEPIHSGMSFAQNLPEVAQTPGYPDPWAIDDSSLCSYSNSFFGDSNSQMLTSFLERTIGTDANNTGIDVAGGTNGIALTQLIEHGIISRGLVTNYQDRRSATTRTRSDLDHIHGDLRTPEPWIKLLDWQAEQAPLGVDLIMHRPEGGLQYLEPDFYKKAAHTLVSMLSQGGVFITQVPRSLWPSLHKPTPELKLIYNELLAREDVSSVCKTRYLTRAYAVITKAGTRVELNQGEEI